MNKLDFEKTLRNHSFENIENFEEYLDFKPDPTRAANLQSSYKCGCDAVLGDKEVKVGCVERLDEPGTMWYISERHDEERDRLASQAETLNSAIILFRTALIAAGV